MNPFNDANVVIGFEKSDDAAIYRLSNGNLLVQSVDFFTPVVDDPYHFGQIAAANALSDIYAMGARPLFALNIVGFPKNDLPLDVLVKILQGGEDKAREANIAIIGGHSIDDKEPKYGLVVTGVVSADNLIQNSGAQVNDTIILTKPLGTGVIATAIKAGVARQEITDVAIQTMMQLNKTSAEIMVNFDVHACSDVTGFGLLGHLKEMLDASNVSAELNYQLIPFICGVRDLAERGIMPGGSRRNLEFVEPFINFADEITELDRLLIADAQTSGGLLICAPEKEADLLIEKLEKSSGFARKIGKIVVNQEKRIIVT